MTFRELNLPKIILDLIEKECKRQGSSFNIDSHVESTTGEGGFNWSKSADESGWCRLLYDSSSNEGRIKSIESLKAKYNIKINLVEDSKIYYATYGLKKYKITIEEI